MNCTRKNLSLLKLVYLRCILYININDWLSIVLAFRQNTYLTQTFLKQILNNIRNQTFILSLILVCLKVQELLYIQLPKLYSTCYIHILLFVHAFILQKTLVLHLMPAKYYIRLKGC